jgi:hypothetical protein
VEIVLANGKMTEVDNEMWVIGWLCSCSECVYVSGFALLVRLLSRARPIAMKTNVMLD